MKILKWIRKKVFGLFKKKPKFISPGVYTREIGTSQVEFPSLLPVAQRVSAQLMSFDLVPTVAMEAPTRKLFYLDCKYFGDTNGRVVLTERIREEESEYIPVDKRRPNRNGRIYNREQMEEYFGRINVEMLDELNNERSVRETLDEWRNLHNQRIGISSRAFGELDHPE